MVICSCVGSICTLCHDKTITEAFEEEKAPFFSWP